MRAAGYEPEDFEGEEFEVWPDNWQVFRLFTRLQTQWNVGMGGLIGLRYEAVYPLLDREAETPQEWDDLLSDIQVMEGAALKQSNKSK